MPPSGSRPRREVPCRGRVAAPPRGAAWLFRGAGSAVIRTNGCVVASARQPHACSTAGAWPRANGAMPENDATAAATRDGFAFIFVASWRSPPSRSRAPRTWSEPPMPQRYTDPSTRGYTSRWQPLLSSAPATWIVRGDESRRRRGRDADSPWNVETDRGNVPRRHYTTGSDAGRRQKSAHGSSATAASPLKTTDDEYLRARGGVDRTSASRPRTRFHRLSTWQPRRRRNSSENIRAAKVHALERHLEARRLPEPILQEHGPHLRRPLVSTEYPRRGRGVAATRLHGISTS